MARIVVVFLQQNRKITQTAKQIEIRSFQRLEFYLLESLGSKEREDMEAKTPGRKSLQGFVLGQQKIVDWRIDP